MGSRTSREDGALWSREDVQLAEAEYQAFQAEGLLVKLHPEGSLLPQLYSILFLDEAHACCDLLVFYHLLAGRLAAASKNRLTAHRDLLLDIWRAYWPVIVEQTKRTTGIPHTPCSLKLGRPEVVRHVVQTVWLPQAWAQFGQHIRNH